MDVTMFRREVHAHSYIIGTEEVLLKAVRVARNIGNYTVDPVHVLLAILEQQQFARLRARLTTVGFTVDLLRQSAAAMRIDEHVYRSRIASQAMFAQATRLSDDRRGNGMFQTKLTAGDIMLGCIVSESRVIDTIIGDALGKTVFEVLVELNAPDSLMFMFFPADNVGEVLATTMSAEASMVLS